MTTTVASLQAIFGADTTQFDNAVGRVKGGLSGLGQQVGGTLESIGGGMQSAGMKIGLGIAPLAAFGYKSIDVATQFDSAMVEISARTGLVGDDLLRIEDYALAMGAATVFSAQESADAFLQLITSGQSVEEAIATLPFVMDAAAASGAGLGYTADLLTDIMAAYGLSVTDAQAVTDALAQAAGASSADMQSLGQGFANVGPIAKNYGMDVEQTAATLALLSENGIKGAEAGTALKSMLMNMTRPTEDVQAAWAELGLSFYDAEGSARPLGTVLDELGARLADGSFTMEQQNEIMKTLGGSYGATALAALTSGMSIDEMIALMNDQATASEVAEKRMDTFAGAMDGLKGAVETLQIKAFRPFMNNTLRPLAQQAAKMINLVGDWAAEHPGLVRAVGLLVVGLSALSAALIVGGGLVSFIGVGIGALLSPIGLVVAAVAALGLAFKTNFLGFGDFVRDLGAGLKNLFGDLKDAFDEKGLEGVLGVLWDKIKTGAIDAVTWVEDSIVTPIVDAVKGINWDEVPGQIEDILDKLASGAATVGDWIDSEIVTPIVDELKLVDWAGVGSTLLDLLDKLLGVTAAGLSTIGGWALEHIVTPVVDELGAVDWAGVASRLGDLLEKFLGLAAAGISAMGVWVWDNIVSPIVSYLTNVNWSNTISRLGDLLEKFLGLAAAGLVSIGTWVWDNIVSPAVDYLGAVDWGGVGNKLLDLLGKFLGFVGAGITSVGDWAYQNIVQPIIDKFTDPATWENLAAAAANMGKGIVSGVVSGLGNLAYEIRTAISGQLEKLPDWMIPDGWLMDLEADIGGGSAGGGPVAGGVPRVVGETGMEIFVPPTSGQILTSQQVARGVGSGSQVVISGGTFILQGIQDTQKLFDELRRIAERRA